MKLMKNKNYLFFVFYGIISILLGVLIDERIKKRDMKVSSPPGYHVDILQIHVNNWCCHYFSGCAQGLLQQER